MSYCRWAKGVSDVYVIATGDGYLCVDCEETDGYTETPRAMLAHLEHHRARGHLVPESALERLREEMAEQRE